MNETARQNEQKIDETIERLQPVLVQAHYKAALSALQEAFDQALERGPEAVRTLIEKIHSVAGSTPMHLRGVSLQARQNKT